MTDAVKIVLGIVLLLPVAYFTIGWLAVMAFSSGLLEVILDWFLPVVIAIVLVSCLIGGVWLIWSGVS